jgi:hypothetical protein
VGGVCLIHHSSFIIIFVIFVGKYIIMAVISMFYGLIISLFYGDNRQHHSPHIHVKYQNDEAVFSIPDGALIEGALPPKKIQLVRAWIVLHEED